MASLTEFIERRLRLKVNEAKSAVGAFRGIATSSGLGCGQTR